MQSVDIASNAYTWYAFVFTSAAITLQIAICQGTTPHIGGVAPVANTIAQAQRQAAQPAQALSRHEQ